MAIFFQFGETGNTVYSFIRKASDGTIWNGSAFAAYSAASWTSYAVTMSEQTSSGWYYGTFPAGITDDDFYHISTYYQSGGSPAAGDTGFGQDSYKFDGTNLYNGVSLTSQMKDDVLTQIQNAFNAAIPVSPVADSIYERIKAIDDRLPSGFISGFDPTTQTVNLAASQTGVTIGTVNALGSTATGQVNAEMLDVLVTDVFSELSSIPSASTSLKNMILLLYMMARNKRTASTTQEKVHNSSGTVIATASVSDSGTVYTKEVFS